MTTDPLIGTKLGDYNIIDLLGRGGMSRVYRGYDDNLERYAAVKVISGDFATTSEEEYTRRFQSEARAIARLRHPNIVGVYQFGRSQGIYYMAMVWLDGKDLRAVLQDYAQNGQRMPVSEVLRISYDVATALDYAHEQGVIHRDIKPSNIMLERHSGRAVLMDFGLALSIHEGTQGDTFGSAHYIAPEQARSSAQAVPQSDLYSLGVVLYEMLTGRMPFDEPSAMSVALHHLNDPPPPPRQINPDLSPEVERVLLQALDKDPGHRFPNGETLVRTLAQALRDREQVERSPSQITASPVLLDMLERPAAREDTPSFSVRPSSPSSPGGTPTPLVPPAGSGSGRLAQRFAERKAQKEQEAAQHEIDEESLQIDDQTLNAILQSYDDPGELGDSWASTGHTQTDVTADEPSPGARPRRRSRVGLLLTLILLVAIGGLGAYFGLGIGREDDTGGVALNPDSPTEPADLAGEGVTADATSRMTGTLTAAATGQGEDVSGAGDDGIVEDTLTPTASPTASPAPPSATPTSPDPEDLPPALPTFADGSTPIIAEVSGTPAPTETPTPPDTPTPRPTLTPTTRPSATPRPTTAATDTPRPTADESGTVTASSTITVTPEVTSTARGSSAAADISPDEVLTLIYDDQSLLLINNTAQTVDISGWRFEQVRADDTRLLFEASTWGRYAARPPSQMLPESCYQIIVATATQETPDDELCPRFLGWYRATIPQRYFWLDFDEADTFVVYDGDDELIATCALDADRCTLPMPPA